ncbi:MAG: long-chain fatty acid--CoA ligase [Parachlamydia sp.]|nr:MAG: long-chain fatty acid--CoA ligase [Parachlamydia sp.]
MKPFKTVADILRCISDHYACPKAFNHIENQLWVSFSSAHFVQLVKHLTLYLHSLKLERGSRIGIMGPCSVYWTVADFAIMLSGGVSVPLFANISNENFDFEVHHADVKILFAGGQEQWQTVEAHRGDFETVISFDREGDPLASLTLFQAIALGAEIEKQEPALFPSLLDAVREEDLATIVFTSGSTGLPKGVELTQKNLASLLHIDPFNWNPQTDRYLSVLPLAHIFARTLNFIMVAWGIRVYYLHNVKLLGEAAPLVKPTILVLVPRILEKVQANILAKINASSWIKKCLGKWAWNLARAKGSSFHKNLLLPLADTLVFSRFREAMGGKLRLVISGGAHLNPELYRFFLEIGFPLYEGYGLTEVSTVACNRPNRIKIGTVGLPFQGITTSLSPEGELLVKGDLVMRGYHKNPEATAAAFTREGWLRTGDKATIDADGFVTILGRLKEMFKTSKGEYISPVPIEQLLTRDPLIDMAMVIADRRPFATCLLFPDLDFLRKLQKKKRAQDLSVEEFLKHPDMLAYIYKLLSSTNEHLNHWEELRDFRIIETHPSVEGGELTPTMKLRREVIEKKYAELINSMYLQELI